MTVQKGDTLYSLARKNGLTVGQLRDLNGLKDNTIAVGQVLSVRSKGAASQAKAAPALGSSSRPTKSVVTTAPTHTVKPGDTLAKIARLHHTSAAHLKALNGLNSNTIHVGMVLRLTGQAVSATKTSPKSGQATQTARPVPATTPKPAPVRPATDVIYTVQAGDTLGQIAARHGVSVAAIQAANRLSGHVISVGQRLTIPARGAAVKAIPALPRGMEARLIYTYERVKNGDTPSSFAARFKVSPAQVRQLNGLSTINQIMPGAKLLVPRRLAVPVPPRSFSQAVRYRSVNVQGVSVQVVQVDLRHRDVLVAPVLPTRGLTFGVGATVRSLTYSSGARALVNGSYFHPRTYAPAGDIVMQGRLLTWGRLPAALAITPDNRASIQGSGRGFFARPGDDTWAGMETVIASGPRIVAGGSVTSTFSRIFQDPAVFSTASRSALGLISSRDLLLVSTHAKVSVTQMGRIMALLGARDALLLDGGSSAGISWNGSVLLDSVRKVSYGIGVFTNYTGRRYAR